MLIKSVEAPSGYPAQIHCCGSQTPDRNTFTDHSCKNIQGPVWQVQVSIWKSCHQAGFDYRCFFTYADRLIVQGGPEAFLRKVKFLVERVVNGAKDHFSKMFQADGYAANGNTVCKIHGAVDRVNDPFV